MVGGKRQVGPVYFMAEGCAEEGEGIEEQDGQMAEDGRWMRDDRGRGWLK